MLGTPSLPRVVHPGDGESKDLRALWLIRMKMNRLTVIFRAALPGLLYTITGALLALDCMGQSRDLSAVLKTADARLEVSAGSRAPRRFDER